MYAVVGSGMEFELAWQDKIAALNPEMLVVDCSRGVDLIATGEGERQGTDPTSGSRPETRRSWSRTSARGSQRSIRKTPKIIAGTPMLT